MNSFSPRESSILFNTSSLRSDAHEARQRDSFWKDSRGEVDKTLNDEHTLMPVLSALPEHGLEVSWKWLNLPQLLTERERRLPKITIL